MRRAFALLLVVLGCGSGSATGADAMAGADAGGDRPVDPIDAPADTLDMADASDGPVTQHDAPVDIPAPEPDAPADVAPPQADADPDAGADATGDAVTPDSGGDAVTRDSGGDAGPFSCAAGVICQANEYCVPQCCGTCFVVDGGTCPAGTTSCELGGGALRCSNCAPSRCVNTIPFGCNAGNPVEPRRLFCLCG